MKQLLAIVLLCTGMPIHAQQGMPSFYTVANNFCRSYALPPDGYDSVTRFAKKQEGWFVQQVQLYPREKVLQEQLFYSLATARYNTLNTWYQPATGGQATHAAMEKLLQPDGNNIDWYCYDRARYYGYAGWQKDMITTFESDNALNDSLLDALARAYSHQAGMYLWHQQGDSNDTEDTLQQKLARLQYPSPQRLAKVKAYLHKSIACYKRIEARNPAYQTMVGDVALKRFNETMHGYLQLLVAGDSAGAAAFLDSAVLAPGHIQQAKNHLNSCLPNAILFTYGDNDTYQLWYVQQKMGYRKDVTVINNSLLGVSAYVNLLRQKKPVAMRLPNAFLKNENAYYAVKKEAGKKAGQQKSTTAPLKETLLAIYNGSCVQQAADADGKPISIPAYQVDTAVLTCSVAGGKPVRVKVPLGRLLYISDLVMLDIIASNVDRRPVYFTGMYDNRLRNYLRPEGILHRLYPRAVTSNTSTAADMKALEQFAHSVYIPVCTRDDRFVCYDGDNAFINIYPTLIEYYHDKKDKAATNRWLAEMLKHCPALNRHQASLSRYLCYLYTTLERKDLLEPLAKQYANMVFSGWQQPDVLQSSFTGQKAIAELKQLQNYLQHMGLPQETVDKLQQQMEAE